jgi:hypothetical protein
MFNPIHSHHYVAFHAQMMPEPEVDPIEVNARKRPRMKIVETASVRSMNNYKHQAIAILQNEFDDPVAVAKLVLPLQERRTIESVTERDPEELSELGKRLKMINCTYTWNEKQLMVAICLQDGYNIDKVLRNHL